MNREILFRGKNVRTNEWVYGDLLNWYDTENNNKYNPCIIPIECSVKGKSIRDFIVIPETIGQYTEVIDKNNIKIFEGDIVEIDSYVAEMFKISSKCKIIFKNGNFLAVSLEHETEYNLINSIMSITDIYYTFRGKVIGNIYDKEVK